MTAIAAGNAQSLALKSDGTVVAWGCAGFDHGQCSVPSGLSGVTAIAAGNAQSLALKSDGTVIAWGCGPGVDLGQCKVPAGLSGVTAISAGAGHSLALVALRDQTITFGPLANKHYGDPDFAVSAKASSGLPVSFAARGRARYRRDRASNRRRIVHDHSFAAGDATYNAAPDVLRTFSIAPTQCTVPNVVGKRLSAAMATIAKRHCRTGRVAHAYSRKRKTGVVISQSRRPGKVLPARSKIDLIVSRGR